MTELTQFKTFLQGLVKPIIDEAIEEAVMKALSHTSSTVTASYECEQVPDLLNVKQTAAYLGIAPQTVYQNIGRLPHVKKHGRLYFRKDELLAYLEEGRSVRRPVSQKNRT